MTEKKLKIEMVLKNKGIARWQKITHILLPSYPNYDGGAPGVSTVETNGNGNWKRRGCFYCCADENEFIKIMADHLYCHCEELKP